MGIDVSAGLKMKLDDTVRKAKKRYAADDVEGAAHAYRQCAKLMKELVRSAVGAETQKARLEKARQYLQLAKDIEEGRSVAVTPGEKKARAAYSIALAAAPEGVRVKSNRNLLFYGPPGTGKTLLAAATSNELDATFFNVKVSSLLSKFFGESAKMVSALFTEARRRAPSVVFFDEIEALVPSRSGNVDGAKKRILSTFLAELDGMASKGSDDFLLTVAATNTPWSLDEAILSRFGKFVHIPLPDPETRRAIFRIQIENAGHSAETPVEELVERSEGYSGRDIEKLCTEAVERMLTEANRAIVEMADQGAQALRAQKLQVRPVSAEEFDEAFRKIRPKTNEDALRRYADWSGEEGEQGMVNWVSLRRLRERS